MSRKRESGRVRGWSRLGAGGGAGRAFTLVEILIAALVMAAVIVPLLVLLTQERTDELSDKGLLEAVSVASNIMEQLLSASLPFKAIDCKPSYTSGYTKSLSGAQQAGFSLTNNAKTQYEPILGDAVSTNPDPIFQTRTKIKGGVTYYVYFFAGKYPDDDPVPDTREQTASPPFAGTPGAMRPDIDHTLSFVYLENPARFGLPWGLGTPTLKSDTCQMIILGTPGGSLPKNSTGGNDMSNNELVPYNLRAYTLGEGLTPTADLKTPTDDYHYSDPTNFRLVPGWPKPSADGLTPPMSYDVNDTQQRATWMKAVEHVVTGTFGAQVQYHPRAVDQRTFKATGGAYMKLIVGVKFFPYEQSMVGHSRGTSAQNAREFWLVSFKADLEST